MITISKLSIELEWIAKHATLLGRNMRQQKLAAIRDSVRHRTDHNIQIGLNEGTIVAPASEILEPRDGILTPKTLEPLGGSWEITFAFPDFDPDNPWPINESANVARAFSSLNIYGGKILVHEISGTIPFLRLVGHEKWAFSVSKCRKIKHLVLEAAQARFTGECNIGVLEERGNVILSISNSEVEYSFITGELELINVKKIQFIAQLTAGRTKEGVELRNCQLATSLKVYSTFPKVEGFWFGEPIGTADLQITLRDRRVLARILATMTNIQKEHGLEYYSSGIAQLSAYIESRESLVKRFLFWFHEGYQALRLPSITFVIALLLSATTLYAIGSDGGETLIDAVTPKVVLHKLLSFVELSPLAVALKIPLFIWQRVMYFSGFCFIVAMKRRFGFPKFQP
ncbi:MAG: hypothetical protein K8S54_10520 [Spirochaetia bacterium]|nr:hypothetical protein [Spirochaetia bacterium]